ncbi:hypothetical protein V8C34DRAFT_307717 [Trichoderma compactum]
MLPSGAQSHDVGVTSVGDPQVSRDRRGPILAILRQDSPDPLSAVYGEALPVLGLRNTFNSYLFMEVPATQERWKTLLGLVPQRDEVLRFSPSYKTPVTTFPPMMTLVDDIENEICRYLQDLDAGELQNPNKISEKWALNSSVSKVALILATLATSAHYSMLEDDERSECCLNFCMAGCNIPFISACSGPD